MVTKTIALPPAPITSPSDSFSWAEWYRILRTVANLGQVAYITVNDTITPTLNSKLNKDANDVLNGTISFGTLGAFKVGTATWNGTSGTGTGVLFTQNGIVGMNGGSPKFVLKVDGTATFGGDLTAATGTFAGSISTYGYVKAYGYSYDITYGRNAVITSSTSNGADTALLASCTSYGSEAIYAFCDLSGKRAIRAWGTNGASAIEATGNVLVYGQVYTNNQFVSDVATGTSPVSVSSTTTCTNLNADMVDGVHLSGLLQTNNSVTSGSATATFSGTNKPGSNSSASWLPVTIAGTTYYIPVWT